MSSASLSVRAARARLTASGGAVVLAGALPFLFLGGDFQPDAEIGVGSTSVRVTLSDVAVLAVVLAGAVAARTHVARLRHAGWAWALVAALLAWIVAGVAARAGTGGYPASDALVTAAKFAEYALLAPAVPLLLRRRRDVELVAWTWVGWLALAAAVGLVQLVGIDIFRSWTAWYRQPSFTGHHDLAAMSAGGLALASAAILFGPRLGAPRRLAGIGGVAGAIAMILSGTLVGALGFTAGAAVLGLVAWSRLGARPGAVLRLAVLTIVVLAGVFAFRGGDVLDFARFLGIGPGERKTTDIETYSQRTVLLYIGGRIVLDNPIAGIGWQGSAAERGYGPYVADARARFPTVADEAFPGQGRPWGIQNAYVQAAADLGLPGALLFLAVVLAPFALLLRPLRSAPAESAGAAVAVATIAFVVAGLWLALGLVAGIPLDAVMWLALGLVAALRAGLAEPAG
ncbi:MAG: O-antigen ligase family protein [Actinobacteria bacterium]|nr:O-antigen ligase family protein [Actinomycetota bacterium]